MIQVQLVNLNLFGDFTDAVTKTAHGVDKIVSTSDPKAKGVTDKVDSGFDFFGGAAKKIDSVFQPKLIQLDLFHDIAGAVSGAAGSTDKIVGDVGSDKTKKTTHTVVQGIQAGATIADKIDELFGGKATIILL